MKERFVEIETPSGPMETFVTCPEQDGPYIWGVREELFDARDWEMIFAMFHRMIPPYATSG